MTSTYLPQISDRVVGLDGHGVSRAGWVCGPVTVAGDPVAIPDLGVTFLTDVQLAGAFASEDVVSVTPF